MRALWNIIVNSIPMFEVLAAVTLNTDVLWDVAACNLVSRLFCSNVKTTGSTHIFLPTRIPCNSRLHVSSQISHTFLRTFLCS
jgi:hypothetical protein